jgi:hypothetical protein
VLLVLPCGVRLVFAHFAKEWHGGFVGGADAKLFPEPRNRSGMANVM